MKTCTLLPGIYFFISIYSNEPYPFFRPGEKTLIGVLDMPGFEATEYNTLQQLMVNVLNEQIQYFYNQAVFTWEMVSKCIVKADRHGATLPSNLGV